MRLHSNPLRAKPPREPGGGVDALRGQTIPLFARRSLDLESLGAGTTATEVVARGVRVEESGQAQLLLRVHANALGADRHVIVSVFSEAPTFEDPDVDFVAEVESAAVRVDESTPAGTLLLSALRPGFSYALRAVTDLTNGSGSGTGGGSLELSADLFVRCTAPGPKYRILSFGYTRNNNTPAYVPFREVTEASSPDNRTSMVADGAGQVEMVSLWSQATPGTTTVSVVLNGSVTVGAATKTLPANTVTNYRPAPPAKFRSGDLVQVLVSPTDTGGTGITIGTVVVRMDGEAK